MAKGDVLGIQPKVKVTETVKTEKYGEIFVLVKTDKNVKIAVGNALVSKLSFKSLKDAKTYIDSKPWELLVNVICYLQDLSKQVINQPSKSE